MNQTSSTNAEAIRAYVDLVREELADLPDLVGSSNHSAAGAGIVREGHHRCR